MITTICPYYHSESQTVDGTSRVNCEGGHIRFLDKDSRRCYMYEYCATNWQACTVAQMMNDYYARKGPRHKTTKEGTNHGKM